jgi:hypothetical protein
VASVQAKSLLRDSIQPEIDTFKREAQQKAEAFDTFLHKLREENLQTYAALAGQLETIKKRTQLMELADRAVSEGDRKAFDQLMQVFNAEDHPLKPLAGSLIFQVKSFYLAGSRTGGHKLVIRRFARLATDDPQPPTDESSYSTDDLVYALQYSEHWADRAKAAELLRLRRRKEVPDALFNSMLSDEHLEVVRNAVRSFEGLTGYQSRDIFGQDGIEGWWHDHRDEVLREFPPSG